MELPEQYVENVLLTHIIETLETIKRSDNPAEVLENRLNYYIAFQKYYNRLIGAELKNISSLTDDELITKLNNVEID
tara:strand:- start:1542 stop:1772 length:231 start_codon:yes stop_codon:yes gene_type:complete